MIKNNINKMSITKPAIAKDLDCLNLNPKDDKNSETETKIKMKYAKKFRRKKLWGSDGRIKRIIMGSKERIKPQRDVFFMPLFSF